MSVMAYNFSIALMTSKVRATRPSLGDAPVLVSAAGTAAGGSGRSGRARG